MRAPWLLVWQEDINEPAPLNRDLRGFFPLPTLALAPAFRVYIPSLDVGDCRVTLRFGFEDTDAAVSTFSIVFRQLIMSDESDFQTCSFDRLPGPFGAIGSPLGIPPPLVAVLLTTTVKSVFTYQVFAACVGVE